MDSTKKFSLVTVDDDEVENIKDNGQLIHDIGQKEDTDDSVTKTLIMEIYPWISQFKKICRSSLAQRTMESLKNLMMLYSSQIRPSVNECRTKPLRADKLKDSMSETLLFFLYYYREIGKDQDRNSYMDLMSDLLAMYIDMELKASKKANEHHSKISARLSSCLHVYLEHSPEHLLDTLLKVHFMNYNYHEILDPVITKIFKGIQEHPSSSIMYVRYLLAYRLWKKLNKDVAVRNQINVTALSSLGTAPAEFHPFLIEYVLPKVPKSQKLTTKLLLLHKFEVEKSCEEFLNFCKKEKGLDVAMGKEGTCLTDTVTSAVPEDNDSRDLIVHDNVENLSTQPEVGASPANLLINKSLHNENDTNSKRPSVTNSATSTKLSSSRKAKKSNDIVFIDLTSDSVTEKIIKKKKTRRKLSWLEEAKKRVSVKTPEKKHSTAQDEAASAQQLEDNVNLHSLRIDSPRSQCADMEICGVEEISVEDAHSTPEDQTSQQSSVIIDNRITQERTAYEITNTPDNASQHYNDCSDETALDNEKTLTEKPLEERKNEIVTNALEVSTMETDTTTTQTDNCSFDEYLNENKIDDAKDVMLARAELPYVEAGLVLEQDKTLVKCPVSGQIAIKAEHINEEPYEIINEEVVSSEVELPVAEYASEVSLQTSCDKLNEEPTVCESKIKEVDFQDNIDGLSLLASVSQRVSHLTTSPIASKNNSTNVVDLIKVKNYASLVSLNAVEEPDTSTDALAFCENPGADVINRIVGIYPEDAMEKVAFEVEVTSTGEMDSYEGCEQVTGAAPFLSNTDEACCNGRLQTTNIVNVPESSAQAEKDDTNVILNGETVVLFQKSPNSNVYIINKAVENRDHVNDEVPNGLRELTEHASEGSAFSYDLYDNMYRGQPPPYDLTQYNRELSVQENRRGKKVIVDSVEEANIESDPLELAKPGMKKTLPLDVIGKGSPGKRKSPSSNSSIARRRRIKQEYNGCSNNLPGHINPNYGIQECAQERVESSRSIHMPVNHSSPLSSMYAKYPAGAELYLPCHKNCNSMTCGLPVNSASSLHPHPGKASSGGKPHCSCLNCTYDIVAHCTECILPSGETRTSSIDSASYYLPIHSSVQNSAVQDCNRTSGDEPLVKMYDEKLVCKLEQSVLDSKPLGNVGVKFEPEPIYRAELDNKLPLKKRFKAMMSVSFEEMSIKREKVQSYPGTPMLSIAAIDAQEAQRSSEESSGGSNNSMDLSPKFSGETHSSLHRAEEMIRRDYRKDIMMSPAMPTLNVHHGANKNAERKRKRRSAPNPSSCNVDEVSYQKICKTPVNHKQTTAMTGVVSKRLTTPTKSQARPSEKVKELDAVPLKNSTRQTRSSKRNVPKVNYIYADGDSDWNPSGGGAKRKRKKTSR